MGHQHIRISRYTKLAWAQPKVRSLTSHARTRPYRSPPLARMWHPGTPPRCGRRLPPLRWFRPLSAISGAAASCRRSAVACSIIPPCSIWVPGPCSHAPNPAVTATLPQLWSMWAEPVAATGRRGSDPSCSTPSPSSIWFSWLLPFAPNLKTLDYHGRRPTSRRPTPALRRAAPVTHHLRLLYAPHMCWTATLAVARLLACSGCCTSYGSTSPFLVWCWCDDVVRWCGFGWAPNGSTRVDGWRCCWSCVDYRLDAERPLACNPGVRVLVELCCAVATTSV
jgi:hypothetical protein